MRASGGVFLYSDASSTAGVRLAAGSGSWDTLSSRTAKTNISQVDDSEVLRKISQLDVWQWRYEGENENVKHMGPFAEVFLYSFTFTVCCCSHFSAQDFYDAFGLGSTPKRISTVDADGVAFAGLRALAATITEMEQENAELRDIICPSKPHLKICQHA